MSINLHDWVLNLFKSRDAFSKQIIKVEKTTLGFKIHKKEVITDCIIIPKITSAKEILGFLHEGQVNVFVLNLEQNLIFLVQNWNRLINYLHLKFFFVNPRSGTETKWVISPFMHDRVSEKSSLEKGLRAMFNTVEPV